LTKRVVASAARSGQSVPCSVLDGAWTIVRGEGPIVAIALHDGHHVRPEVLKHLAVSEVRRLHEEDPKTGSWVSVAPNRVTVHRSRFEVDLNRPPEQAVYAGPEHAWGLEVWKGGEAPPWIVEQGRALHEAFYQELSDLLGDMEARHGPFVVFDLHSYNHRRSGPTSPPDSMRTSPDVNVGTGSLDRMRWKPVIDALMGALSRADVLVRRLEVRENVRFQGGYLAQWVHGSFPRNGCVLAIDVKKFFMDEWTGEVEPTRLEAVELALARTLSPVLDALASL